MLPILAVGVVLAGHWIISGAGVIVDGSYGERRFIGHQHPLNKVHEVHWRPLPEQLRSGSGVQADEQKETEAIVRV